MHDAHSTDSVKRGRCEVADNLTIFAELGIPNIGDEVIFVELCAGSGILSKTAEEHGFATIPIDHDGNRHRTFTKVYSVDLADDKAWTFLDYLQKTARVVAWHMGLPCGTCSRAREIPISDTDPGPPPLRNAAHPLGVPWNSERDAHRVRLANELYQRACAFALQLVFLRHVVTIENPTDSWLWELPFVTALYSYCFFVDLHACMFGGSRRKRTSFLTNESKFQVLQIFCDGSHEHAAWGMDESGNFNTAHEAQYPKRLCHEYCKILDSLRDASHASDTVATEPHDTDMSAPSAHRAFMQPRGRKVQQLVPEFQKVFSVVLGRIPNVDGKKRLQVALGDIPAGAKLLRTEAKQGSFLCVFGVHYTAQQFVWECQQLQHPFDEFMNLPDILLECVYKVLVLGPIDVAKFRLAKIQRWRQIRDELAKTEAELHEVIPSHMRTLVQDKQFLLFEYLAKSIGWDDHSLHDELREGFKLVGEGTPSNVFKTDIKRATMDEKMLMDQAKFIRPMILGKVKNAEKPEYCQELNEITRAEAGDKGWLEGPFDEGNVSRMFGSSWLPVERFAVRQKDKLRPIDNFATNRVNEAWTCPEKLDLHSLDQLAWTISALYKFFGKRGGVDITLKDGRRLQGEVHCDWLKCDAKCLITTLDLKDAYKQLGIHESDRNKAVVTLRSDRHNGVDCYTMNCLPFGASSSVHNFNRVARLLWAIGVVELMIPWVNYFDDYPMVSPGAIATSTLSAAKSMLHLLGFKYAAHKLEQPKGKSEVLGVVVDCDDVLGAGILRFSMKENRRHEILECLETILHEKELVPFNLPSVLGRVQFADGQLAGRTGRLAMADVREIGLTSKSKVALDDGALEAFAMLKTRFEQNTPKSIRLRGDGSPVLLFTDGSFEPSVDGDKAMIGGVLIIDGFPCRVFGGHVPSDLLDRWRKAGKEHLIGQVEMYAIVVARYLWKHLLQNRRVILFVDNWGVLDCYIPGTSKERTWRELLLRIEEIDATHPSYIWATRVPSESNVADPPSRGLLSPIQFLGELVVDEPCCPIVNICLKSCLAEADKGLAA